MNATLRTVTLASVFLFLLAPAQAADGLRIRSGGFSYAEHHGRMTIESTSGFHLDAAVSETGGFMALDHQCGQPECEPGTTTVDLQALWSGLDLTGTLRVRGQSFILGGLSADAANGIVEFEGTLSLPEVGDVDTIHVSAPFTMLGSVEFPTGDGQFALESLAATGTATSTFTVNADRTCWVFIAAEYTFDPQKVKPLAGTADRARNGG